MGYSIGDKVIINDYCLYWSSYKNTVGKIGVIQGRKSSAGNYPVLIDGMYNTKVSSYSGCFWINENYISLVNKEEEKQMTVVKGNYKVAMVKFLQGTNTTMDYAFALFDDSIKKDDYVLVDTSKGFSVAKVSEVKSQVDYDGVTVTKEVVCKVDFADFEKRKENRKKKDALKKRMDAMIKDNQEVVLYEMLAKTNPDMAEMLKEYKELSNA